MQKINQIRAGVKIILKRKRARGSEGGESGYGSRKKPAR